jgi:hypothetical protein
MDRLLREDATIEAVESGSNHRESLAASVAAQQVVRPAISADIEQPRPVAVESHPRCTHTPLSCELLTLVAQMAEPADTTSVKTTPLPGDRRAVPCVRCVRWLAQGRTSSCSSQQGKGLGTRCVMCASQGYTCERVDDQLVDLAAAVGAASVTLAATSAAYDKAAAAGQQQKKKGKDKRTAAAAPAFDPAPATAAPTAAAAAKAAGWQRKAKQEPLALEFSYFSCLPTELQDMIWDFAASLPKVIHIFVRGRVVTRAYIQSDASRACRASRKYRRHIHQFCANLGRIKLPVDFDSDLFFIHGLGHCSDLAHLEPFCRDLKKVILPCEVPPGLPELLKSDDTGPQLQLQEVWVLRQRDADLKTFYPASGSQFQRHCALHHHEVLPSAFFPVPWIHDSYRGPWRDERRRFCPACDWNAEFTGISAIALDPMLHHFRVTYDALLPRYPSAAQVSRARNPVLRWVRHGELGKPENNEQVVSAVTCLTNTGPAGCSH